MNGRKTAGVLASLLGGVLLAGAGQGPGQAAGQAGSGTAAEQGNQASRKWVEGRVIEAHDRDLAIDASGHMVTLELTGRTQVFVDGKKASASDIRPGKPVMAAYEESGNARRALQVRVDERRRPGGNR